VFEFLLAIDFLLIPVLTSQDSPPPEPTPTPPPQPAPAPPRQVQAISAHQANGFTPDRPANININAANMHHPPQAAPTPQPMQTPLSYNPNHLAQYHQASASPAPALQQFPNSHGYGGGAAPAFAPQVAPVAHGGYGSPHHQSQPAMRGAQQVPPVGYKAPNPVEVWHLPDSANASIPADIRNQFQLDAQGRLLFFTAPPAGSSEPPKAQLAHTPGYVAWKAKKLKEQFLAKKRRAEEEEAREDLNKKRRLADPLAAEAAHYAKLMDIPDEKLLKPDNMLRSAPEIQHEIRIALYERMLQGNIAMYKAFFPEDRFPEGEWLRQMRYDEERTARAQAEHRRKTAEIEKQKAEWAKQKEEDNKIVGLTRMLDYKPPNEHLEWRR
jgi:hypothetical protein